MLLLQSVFTPRINAPLLSSTPDSKVRTRQVRTLDASGSHEICVREQLLRRLMLFWKVGNEMADFKDFTDAQAFLPQVSRTTLALGATQFWGFVLFCFLHICLLCCCWEQAWGRQGDLTFSRGLWRVRDLWGWDKSLIAKIRGQKKWKPSETLGPIHMSIWDMP